ncbi:UDP-glucose/GDP-mannose dehydrogenase family protein [Deefgea piscis]|uniref:UDP-glucose 6-dehydrogenase n=1 Tax=Deefgea piscis TaxID=2739061 RepID=A0A6M8SNN7_9NEIS|nr:UDP-glucose/GDP-mannose dehydrogenase family protein [Deefgea piscis]QKJ66872.1 UDP-glucose/GDP-mannose dehydrogenase family protein [Deefgea piscis]
MKVTVIGSGYVGLVTATCLAEYGNDVLCLDVDVSKIELLNQGGVPIYEPGLEEMIKRNRAASRLRFTSNIAESVAHGTIQFIAVGTPPNEDGSADLQYVVAAANHIGRHMNTYKVIVNKSTVPVGTGDKVRAVIAAQLTLRGLNASFAVVANPEFLKEGAAIDDFMRPDRIVMGCEDETASDLLHALYAPFVRNHDRILLMDIRSAEMTKYAANAMLATRISLMNELANLAEILGADIELVRKGIGADPRIGYHFLYAGVGYGGSCFPKDVQALQRTANENGIQLRVLAAVEHANLAQKSVIIHKIKQRFAGNLAGMHFALWGLAFKPNTDDMRDAPSRVLIEYLLAQGATIAAYDPVAMIEAQRVMPHATGLRYGEGPQAVLKQADALVVMTEWKAFRSPDFAEMKALLSQAIIFDGRNLYEPQYLAKQGFEYYPIGREQIYPALIARALMTEPSEQALNLA